MIQYYWIAFIATVGSKKTHEETVILSHPFVAIREIKIKRKNDKVCLLNYKPINKKEFDLFTKLNTKA